MSHEIRTPMNGVLGFAELLAESALDEFQSECVQSIRVSAEALLVIINDLLDIAKVEAGKLIFERIPYDPAALVAEICDSFRPRLSLHQRLSFEVADADCPLILGDPGRVRQVLFNLIGNSVKFTPRGEVAVRLRNTQGSHLAIEVHDTGIGIAPEKQKNLFCKFSQADSSTTRRFGGTGLGLAISKQLVEGMGGTIGFESCENIGSIFWIHLPNNSPTAEELAAARRSTETVSEPPAFGGTCSVLVAEDNILNQKLTIRLLEKLGCRADLAVDGLEAVQMALEKDYDLILMDCQMPNLDGFQSAQMILSAKRSSKILALTANAMPKDVERCRESGMLETITKPLRFSDLKEALERHLGA